MTGWPTDSAPRSRSATSITAQTTEVSATRNSTSPGCARIPSMALRSSTTPSRGADHSIAIGTVPLFSMAAITASGTSRFTSRCREPRP